MGLTECIWKKVRNVAQKVAKPLRLYVPLSLPDCFKKVITADLARIKGHSVPNKDFTSINNLQKEYIPIFHSQLVHIRVLYNMLISYNLFLQGKERDHDSLYVVRKNL